MPPHRPAFLYGTVLSAGRMMKAVKVRTTKQTYNSFLKKHFTKHESHIVADPTSSLRTGDTVRIVPGWHGSKTIKHVVAEIIAPWGEPIDHRPPLIPIEDLFRQRDEKRTEKRRDRLEKKVRGGGDGGSGGERGKERKSVDEVRGEQVRRIENLRESALENEGRAEALQAELDGKGIREEDVRRRLEGVDI